MSTFRLLVGDCREMLRTLPDESVHCVVTSPPYWGLRDYGHDDQLGLEPTPELYVEHMVEVFREVRRVLREDGTLWLNLGDSYARPPAKGGSGPGGKNREWYGENYGQARGAEIPDGLKPKDLVGIPWRVAFALQADGWYLRSDIIWAKPNPMPESVQDRPTKAHEYVFLLSKSKRYYYDHYAIREPIESGPSDIKKMREGLDRIGGKHKTLDDPLAKASAHTKLGRKRAVGDPEAGRNARSVWTITTKPYSGAHFATFPPELAEKCILAGCPKGGIVLDPFAGSGTTGMVATGQGRNAILIELNPRYAELIRDRIGPMLETQEATDAA